MNKFQAIFFGFVLFSLTLKADDYPDDSSTRIFLQLGSSTNGVTETSTDQDWFKTILIAGRTYSFINKVVSSDPQLIIRGPTPSNSKVAENDDCCGAHSTSQISYTPTTTGIYHLISTCYSTFVGGYQLALADSGACDAQCISMILTKNKF